VESIKLLAQPKKSYFLLSLNTKPDASEFKFPLHFVCGKLMRRRKVNRSAVRCRLTGASTAAC
jgi:hypothetical protein